MKIGDFKHTGQSRFSLKSLSVTRWSAHYEAVWAIKNGYMGIL